MARSTGEVCATPLTLAKELERCDREIAAAMAAILSGSVRLDEAVLWYGDWCRERELLLRESKTE